MWARPVAGRKGHQRAPSVLLPLTLPKPPPAAACNLHQEKPSSPTSTQTPAGVSQPSTKKKKEKNQPQTLTDFLKSRVRAAARTERFCLSGAAGAGSPGAPRLPRAPPARARCALPRGPYSQGHGAVGQHGGLQSFHQVSAGADHFDAQGRAAGPLGSLGGAQAAVHDEVGAVPAAPAEPQRGGQQQAEAGAQPAHAEPASGSRRLPRRAWHASVRAAPRAPPRLPRPPRPASLAAAGSAPLRSEGPPPSSSSSSFFFLRGAAAPFLPQPVQPRRWADPAALSGRAPLSPGSGSRSRGAPREPLPALGARGRCPPAAPGGAGDAPRTRRRAKRRGQPRHRAENRELGKLCGSGT